MAGPASVRASYRWLSLLVAVLTLFAPALPHSAAARATNPQHPFAAVGDRTAATGQRTPDAVTASGDDDADERPRDAQSVRHEPGLAAFAGRAVLPALSPDGVPPSHPRGQPRRGRDNRAPGGDHHPHPEGRGPPRRP
ncbi:hypothetical protein [Asanoa hainanensis]|nr:hypothetical protein [Asanoa hainanensis]